jgi:hypothetical protein
MPILGDAAIFFLIALPLPELLQFSSPTAQNQIIHENSMTQRDGDGEIPK